jgi:hypothetical protein
MEKSKEHFSPSEKRIITYLRTHKCGLTRAEAVEKLQEYSIGQRIHDLRAKGYSIKTESFVHRNKDGIAVQCARYLIDDGKNN